MKLADYLQGTADVHKQHEWIGSELYNVAGTYYECIDTQFGRGYKKWDTAELKSKVGKEAINGIETFSGFCNCPNFLDYKHFATFGKTTYLNLATPLVHKWKNKEGKIENLPATMQLLNHLFGEKYLPLVLDWLQLLISKPIQDLPIIYLYSKEQLTGKSTFLNFVHEILGSNAALISVSDYMQQFNALFATKQCVFIDEAAIKVEAVNAKLKSQTTGKSVQLRKMHTEHQEIANTLHFIMCSNEKPFLDKDDTRYFLMEVKPLESEDSTLPMRISAEIPEFLSFLNKREMHYQYETDPNKVKSIDKSNIASRLYFHPEDFDTPFKSVCEEDSESAEMTAIKDLLESRAMNEADLTCNFTITKLANELMRIGTRVDTKQIKEIISNIAAVRFIGNVTRKDLDGTSVKGRFYSYTTTATTPTEEEEIEQLPF